jgi:uncharacterized protein YjbI with pentapeptide repeats
MRMLHHGLTPATTDLAWFFRVAAGKAGAPVLVLCGSMLVSHSAAPPVRKENKRSAAYRMAPRKIAGDLLVSGRAWPNAVETGHKRAVRIGLEMGTWRKELAVFGDRFWLPGALGSSVTEPREFESIPVTYDRAFGGPGFAWNPEGLGMGPGQRGQTLPNIEFLDRRIDSPSSRPGPAGFGPINPAWRPRADRLGTFDAAWLAEHWPGMPADFSPSYWNEAPGDQQFPNAFRGDEKLAVLNMHPSRKRCEITLPGQRSRAFYQQADGNFAELPMMLDTIAVDMEAGQTELVWRGAMAVRSARLRDIAFLFTLVEPLAAMSALETCRALFEAARRKKYPNAEERQEAADKQRAAREAAVKKHHEKLAADLALAASLAPPLLAAAKARAAEKAGQGKAAAPAGGKPEAPRPRGLDPATAAKIDGALRQAAAAAGAAGGNPEDVWTRERVIATHAEGGDMAGADLSGLDLSALNLTGAKFSGAVLAKTDLTGSWLQGATLNDADLTGAQAAEANFSGAVLTGAKFSGASLTGARFNEAEISGTDFSNLDLTGLYFDRAQGRHASFSGATLAAASFRQAQLPRANFSKSVLARACFDEAQLTQADLTEVSGEAASFLRAQMGNARANKADFSHAKFLGAQAPQSVWLQAKLEHADFSRAVLGRANFVEAALSHAHFDRALLEESCFDEAVMRFAVVTNAKLVRASLERADLRDADFSGSNLYRAGLFRVRSSRLRLTGSFLAGTLMAS